MFLAQPMERSMCSSCWKRRAPAKTGGAGRPGRASITLGASYGPPDFAIDTNWARVEAPAFGYSFQNALSQIGSTSGGRPVSGIWSPFPQQRSGVAGWPPFPPDGSAHSVCLSVPDDAGRGGEEQSREKPAKNDLNPNRPAQEADGNQPASEVANHRLR